MCHMEENNIFVKIYCGSFHFCWTGISCSLSPDSCTWKDHCMMSWEERGPLLFFQKTFCCSLGNWVWEQCTGLLPNGFWETGSCVLSVLSRELASVFGLLVFELCATLEDNCHFCSLLTLRLQKLFSLKCNTVRLMSYFDCIRKPFWQFCRKLSRFYEPGYIQTVRNIYER